MGNLGRVEGPPRTTAHTSAGGAMPHNFGTINLLDNNYQQMGSRGHCGGTRVQQKPPPPLSTSVTLPCP